MKIIIETISSRNQRYPTPGDWLYDDDGTLRIKISDRKSGDESEPGDALKSPYRTQHFCAEVIERMYASMLKVDWREYSEALEYST